MSSSLRTRVRRPVVRSISLDTLESRRHLAAFALDVNFQPASTVPPTGYVADRGNVFGWQGSAAYGWNANNSANMVDRQTWADNRLDTFAYLDRGASKWEVAVPNGQYQVSLTAGDASSTSSYYSLKVEGSVLLSGAATTSSRWLNRSGTVNVTDGRLTLSSGSAAWSNKINSISIRSVGTTVATVPQKPTYLWAWDLSSSSIGLQWADVANETGYTLQRSTDGVNFGTPLSFGANVTTYTASGLQPGTKYTFRVAAKNAVGSSPTAFASATTRGISHLPTPNPTPEIPSAPTYLWSWSTGPNSASLQWANVANESGYRIERSTNGVNFDSLATVNANVTIYSVSALSPGTNYTFRVTAYNAGGSSAAVKTTVTTGGTVTPTTPPTVPTNPTPPPTVPTNTNRFSLSGIVQNEAPASVAIPALRDLGMTSVRLWYSINSWNDQPNMGDINRALTYKNAGFTVTLALVSKTQTDAATAKAYFQRVAGNATARAAIDYWEIGNEPNIGGFWNGSLQSFVTNYMKPAYEAIHPYGELVLGGAASYDVNAVRTMVAAGYNNYCDYVGFHPYGESGAIVIQRARDAKAAFGNKPMIVSEWNVQFVTDRNRMASEVNIAALGLSNIAYLNYYFALRVSNTHVGQGGAINNDGSHNNPFYDVIKSWTR